MQISGRPNDIPAEIRQGLCRPEGTYCFQYATDGLFNPTVAGRLFDVSAGRHVFRLDRDETMQLCFTYASSGVGHELRR